MRGGEHSSDRPISTERDRGFESPLLHRRVCFAGVFHGRKAPAFAGSVSFVPPSHPVILTKLGNYFRLVSAPLTHGARGATRYLLVTAGGQAELRHQGHLVD